MKNLFLLKSMPVALVYTLLLCTALSPAEPRAETTDTSSISRMRDLGEKIDSLEVEKQVKKRSGQPLADLEVETSSLRDSIKMLRQDLGADHSDNAGTGAVSSSAQQPSAPGSFKKWVPWPVKNVFDRILLIAGAITLLIGLLCLCILVALKSRRGNRTPTHGETKRAAAQYEEVKRKVAQAQNAGNAGTAGNGGMDAFGASAAEAAALAMAVPPTETPAPIPSGQSRMPLKETDELRELVIKAASEGADAKEISRRFKISADQVALILKIAGKP